MCMCTSSLQYRVQSDAAKQSLVQERAARGQACDYCGVAITRCVISIIE